MLNSKSATGGSIVISGLCVGGMCAITAGILLALMGLTKPSKKQERPKDFVRFDLFGLLEFNNQDYQREFDRLNPLPDFLRGLRKR